ncbi:MAG: alpha/beta hydrolase [Actinomycetota bacterium]
MPVVTVEGAEIAYEERGKGAPVVLLHGWNSSRKQWLLNLKALSPRLRAIALDLPGYGQSEEGGFPYTLDGMASLLDGFRQALRLPSFHLVGHSMGGCIAIRYATLFSQHVNRLVLVSTPTRTVSLGPWALMPGASFFVSATYRLRGENMLKWMFCRNIYEPEYLDLDFLHANLKANAMATRHALSRSTRLVRHMNLTGDLQSINRPTLVVFGDKDRNVNTREALRQRDLLPRPYLAVLTSCGHCPMYERPGLFNTVVSDFLTADELDAAGFAAAPGKDGGAPET